MSLARALRLYNAGRFAEALTLLRGLPGRTASVFTFADILEAPAKDDVWFVMNIRVTGRRVQVRIDDRLVNDYTEPSDKRTRLTGGTFALQAHEAGEITQMPNSTVQIDADRAATLGVYLDGDARPFGDGGDIGADERR